jgi:hypothetical protein
MKDRVLLSMWDDLAKGKELLEGWQKSRMDQLLAKQKREIEALLQRACLKRDGLERELNRTLELHDKRCNAVFSVRSYYLFVQQHTQLWSLFVCMPTRASLVSPGTDYCGITRSQWDTSMIS